MDAARQLCPSPRRENVEITKMLPPTYVGFLDSTNLVDDADVILLSAVNNNYVAYIPNDDKLGATTKNSGCEFTIEPDSPGMYYLQEKQSRKFCSVNIDGYLTLKSEEGKTLFKLMLSTTGKVRLATTDNKFVRLTDDNFLKADTTEHLIASTSFQLAVDCAGNSQQPSSTEWRNLSSHKKLRLSFICEVTRGFFLVLGFKSFLRTASPSVGLLHLIQGNENSVKALHTLRKELRPTTSVTKAVCSAICFLNIVWKEGLLWKVFKFLQLEEGVIIYTEIFTQVIQVLLLPEAEAALLLGSFTTWALELINTSKKVAVD
ncbi:uncharacterized protein LOC135335677 [Halichondria panicea]|uniref:uncharacterized protein LOC135335677 n=1 Tax=Halichondria panicea TaxID=6063 RepID=UPI00312B9A44